MNKPLSILLTILAAAPVALTAQSARTAAPLPVNGAFDAPAPNWKFVAEGWGRTGFWGTDVAPNDIKREMDGKNPYVWIVSGAGLAKGTVIATLDQPLMINPAWKEIRVSFRSRLSDLQSGPNRWDTARVQLSFKDVDGKALKSYPSVYIEPSTEWVPNEGNLKIPAGAHTFTVQFGFWSAVGNLDLDDLVITPVM